MISKASRGHQLGGLLRYLFGPGRFNEHTEQRVVACSDPSWTGTTGPDRATLRALIAELDDPMVRHGNGTKAGYVYHLAISLPAADGQLTDGQWQQVAERFADRLGFDEQVHWIAIGHGPSSAGNDHLHLVANLIRDDTGRAHSLSYERLRRREACIGLEDQFGLTATAPAGQGQDLRLSRRESEALRDRQIAHPADLAQQQIATLVRAGHARNDPSVVTGYAVAAKTPAPASGTSREPLVWYGGGRLGKDLRLPALRDRWGQSDEERRAAAAAWTSTTQRRPVAQPVNLAAAADALRHVAQVLGTASPADQDAWHAALVGSAGILAAAANTTSNPRTRRELITAWHAVNRAIPAPTSLGIEAAPSDATQLRVENQRSTGEDAAVRRPHVVWPAPPTPTPAAATTAGEISTLLAGASRVLLAANPADQPHSSTHTLVVQAPELAVQIAHTMAAQQDASHAQQRAADATTQALTALTTPDLPAGWRFTRPLAEVLQNARRARELGIDNNASQPIPQHQAALHTQPEPQHGL